MRVPLAEDVKVTAVLPQTMTAREPSAEGAKVIAALLPESNPSAKFINGIRVA